MLFFFCSYFVPQSDINQNDEEVKNYNVDRQTFDRREITLRVPESWLLTEVLGEQRGAPPTRTVLSAHLKESSTLIKV